MKGVVEGEVIFTTLIWDFDRERSSADCLESLLIRSVEKEWGCEQ